jgi:hypothetical protein
MPLTIDMFTPRRVVKTYVVIRSGFNAFDMREEEEFTSEIDALTWADAMNRIDKHHAYYVRRD